ncbi:hypothetical protein AAFF_G00098420, partial [Aldrovandia affinis]
HWAAPRCLVGSRVNQYSSLWTLLSSVYYEFCALAAPQHRHRRREVVQVPRTQCCLNPRAPLFICSKKREERPREKLCVCVSVRRAIESESYLLIHQARTGETARASVRRTQLGWEIK